MNREQSIKACKNGAYTAIFSILVTVTMTVFAFVKNETTGILGIFNDPYVMVDIIIMSLCVYGLFRKSRTAAVTAFCLFLLNKIALFQTTQKGVNATTFAFLYFYAEAIQGAFSYHKIEKTNNPDYKSPPKWTFYLGIPAGILLFGLCLFGLTLE